MQILYNGITIPEKWPPDSMQPSSREPMPVPYLDSRPEVVPIDIGRQLFVDEFLIEDTNLSRTFYSAEKYANNPVIRAETDEEIGRNGSCYLGHGGVFFDPEDTLYKMFYTAGWRGPLALATSVDGLHWERPELRGGTNTVLPAGTGPGTAGHDNCVWLDARADQPSRRFKFMTQRGAYHTLHTSSDGLNWSEGVKTGKAGDYCSFFYNPFRGVWVYSIKRQSIHGRCRYYAESEDFSDGAEKWDEAVYWTNADVRDRPDPRVKSKTQLYSLNVVAYESLLIGLFYIHRGPDNERCRREKVPKLTDLALGYSRDGFHWHRPDRRPFLVGTRKEGDWDSGYLHSTAGLFLTSGKRLIFPYCGFSGMAPDGARGMYHGASIGIAFLRRDGFVSMGAGEEGGILTTRPITFTGSHLFVNVDSPLGVLKVEVLDREGRVIEPFTVDNCQPVSIDSTSQEIDWTGKDDLSSLSEQAVRFRFHLKSAEIYSFWVSPDASGDSNSYAQAGGCRYLDVRIDRSTEFGHIFGKGLH